MARAKRGLKYAALVLAFLALPELVYYSAARMAEGYARSGGAPCAVVVLGYPTGKDGSPSPVQRYRVAVAERIFRENRCELMVLTGGSPHSRFVEAETMAELARADGVPGDKVVLEGRARDTRENIRFALPTVESMGRVFLVSDPLHVLRARRYWCEERPDLCERAVPRTEYRFMEQYLMKWAGMMGEASIRLRDAWSRPVRTSPPGSPATRPGAAPAAAPPAGAARR